MNKIRFKWFSIQKSIEQKSSWNSEEDDKLGEIIKIRQAMMKGAAIYKWTEIAEELNRNKSQKNTTRLGKHCRERWFNHLDPNFKKYLSLFFIEFSNFLIFLSIFLVYSYKIKNFMLILIIFFLHKRGEWTQEEDYSLIKLITKLGKKWSMISRMMHSRNENSVKNRFFALKRKYMKLYKKMPQNEKKMLLFLCQKIKPETYDTEIQLETIKKIKKTPLIICKKPNLTIEIKKNPSFSPTMEKIQKISPFSPPKVKENNISSTELTLNSCLLTVQTAELKLQEEELIVSPNDTQSKTAFMRRTGHRSQTHSPNQAELPQQKPEILIDRALNNHTGYKFHRNQNFSDIPNMYKNETCEKNFALKPVLLYPNKDILNIMKLPFDIIDEEVEKDDMAGDDLSQILSSLSLSDQYLAESNRILNGITFTPRNNSISISESFNRSTSKPNTIAVTNSSGKSSNMLENSSPFLNSLAGPRHAHNASYGLWGNNNPNYNTDYQNYNNYGYGRNYGHVPSFDSHSMYKPNNSIGVEAFNEREFNTKVGNDVFSMQELKEFTELWHN